MKFNWGQWLKRYYLKCSLVRRQGAHTVFDDDPAPDLLCTPCLPCAPQMAGNPSNFAPDPVPKLVAAGSLGFPLGKGETGGASEQHAWKNGTLNRTKQEAERERKKKPEAKGMGGQSRRESNPQKLPSSFSSTELDCQASSLCVAPLSPWTWPMDHHAIVAELRIKISRE